MKFEMYNCEIKYVGNGCIEKKYSDKDVKNEVLMLSLIHICGLSRDWGVACDRPDFAGYLLGGGLSGTDGGTAGL